MNRSTIAELKVLRFWQHDEGSGVLTVIPDNGDQGLSMTVRRVFLVTGVVAGKVRGDHAHRDCTQVVLAISGSVSITIDDGQDSITHLLKDASKGISIPPGLWNKLTFDGPNAMVLVFCDRPYETSDYIRDRNTFMEFKGK